MTKVILDQYSGKKNIKVKSSSKNAKLKTTHKTDTKVKKRNIKAGAIRAGGNIKKAKQKTTPSNFSTVRLMGILNTSISEVVGKNMESPALNFQSGRFASSVRITDVQTTRQGFPSIGYTYMKYPYQTFEPGFRQGSVERDPRLLIERSIREIALELAIGRFYTRRV